MIKTHVCLVSSQPVPNLTPILDKNLAPKRVILLVSPDMKQRAKWLAEAIRVRHSAVKVEQHHIDDPWSLEGIETNIQDLLERESQEVEEQSIVLNATGGTKLMSIAAYEAFRAWELPVFYVHPERDQVMWLEPKEWSDHDLDDRVKLKDFLLAHGACLESEPLNSVPDARRLELAGEILQGIDDYADALGSLNYFVSTAERSLRSEPLKDDRGALARLIDQFVELDVVGRDKGRLVFASEDDRFFVNGGWIEAYVFDAVRKIRNAGDDTIQDIAYNLNIVRRQHGQPIHNELDVAFLRNNRFHLIECKTKRFRGETAKEEGADALYKLDTLRDLMGGLQGRAMLLSFHKLPDHDRRRAYDLGITVCAGRELHHLSEKLKEFMQ